MKPFFADLHIHIGRTESGRPVKITAARDLTFANIARECVVRKGIDIAGIVDCGSPPVIHEIRGMIESGEMVELPGGGLRYNGAVGAGFVKPASAGFTNPAPNSTTVILACELETVEADGSASHHIAYFPGLREIEVFVGLAYRRVTNAELSSQRCGVPARELVKMALTAGAAFVPAHAFTPHKSPYGSCVRRLSGMFGDEGLAKLAAVELGLSADSYLADRIAELAPLTFLSNSDAHSLPKIAREYNVLSLEEPSFEEVVKALRREEGRRVVANYGLDPRLGKYHRTFCLKCEQVVHTPPPALACPLCGGDEIVKGVLDRIAEIADYPEPKPPAHRPPYHYQVPLQFLPGIGAVALGKLLNRFGTEMRVLHQTDRRELELVVGRKLADLIVAAREGTLPLLAGGGGRYGKAVAHGSEAQISMGL
ncbi:MAG: endonuclease Q family protein [Armatimonadota bacterium]